ncbi:hypothetical protein EON67_00045 [archaeon]|nr:MAG: hypothetical protein EON67_00045 [archaeon]
MQEEARRVDPYAVATACTLAGTTVVPPNMRDVCWQSRVLACRTQHAMRGGTFAPCSLRS